MQCGHKETVCIVSTEVERKGHSGETVAFHLLSRSHFRMCVEAVRLEVNAWFVFCFSAQAFEFI